MISRRNLFKLTIPAIGLVTTPAAYADYREYKHEHPKNPSTGSSSHIPGIGESSFNRGSLEKYFEMPECVFITHHAEYVPHAAFEPDYIGTETYPLWVREDAPIESVSLKQLQDFLVNKSTLFEVNGRSAYLVRHSRPINQYAFFNLVGRIGIPRRVAAVKQLSRQPAYSSMRSQCINDPCAVLLGYRRSSFVGLRPLLIDGNHPVFNWRSYPLQTPAFTYTRRGSDVGQALARKFYTSLEQERDLDTSNWNEIINV